VHGVGLIGQASGRHRLPREILFDGSGGQWSALDIVDAEGVQRIIELKEPLLLPIA
jgi:hypothetical protein